MFERKKASEVADKKSLVEIEKYGMGKVRTVKQFEKYVGIPEKWSAGMKQAVNWCDFEHSTKYHFVG